MNGVAMMGAPLSWYGFIPGVAATGPFNEHFVSDIGAAYLAAAVSLALAIGRLERMAAAPAAAFLVLHAFIHLIALEGALRLTGIFVCQPHERTALFGEIVGVYAPALDCAGAHRSGALAGALAIPKPSDRASDRGQ